MTYETKPYRPTLTPDRRFARDGRRADILAVYADAYPEGLTAREVEDNFPRWNASTVRSVINRLCKDGFIEFNGGRRDEQTGHWSIVRRYCLGKEQ